MRRALAPVVLVAAAAALVACNSILGISDHEEATPSGDGGMKTSDSGHEGGRKGRDAEPDDGSGGSPDGTPGDDSGEESGDAEPAGNEGGAVTSLLCAGDAGACVSGGIFSVGRVPSEAGIGALPDGAPVTLTDDGFEFGGTTCDDAGMNCVTGALSP